MPGKATSETFATESFGSPVTRAGRETLPGASAQRRLLVKGTHTTVAIRLRFMASPFTTTTGLLNPAPPRSKEAVRPTRPRPGRSPLGPLQNTAGGSGSEFVRRAPQPGANSIHRLCHLFRRVPRQIFPDGIAEQLAARLLGAPGQPLCPCKYIVRNGNRRLHTVRITRV